MRSPSGDGGHYCRVVIKFQTQELSRDFTGKVISSRSQAAGDENDLCVIPLFFKCSANRGTVRYRDLAIDSQANRENLARDEREVGIQNVTEQKLSASIYDDDAHKKG